jgi:hypothetical protein
MNGLGKVLLADLEVQSQSSQPAISQFEAQEAVHCKVARYRSRSQSQSCRRRIFLPLAEWPPRSILASCDSNTLRPRASLVDL